MTGAQGETGGRTPLPVVILISGSGTNLQAIIDAARDGRAPIEIRAVISNRADAYGLERARRADIETAVLSHRDFPSREAYDAALRELIDGYRPGLVVLAGFMRILTDAFVGHYKGRLINIHPSLLPEFRGLDTHQRALAAAVAEHGCSVHFVVPELDAGPVIVRARVPILPGDDVRELARRVQVQEHRIYPLAVKWLAEGRVEMRDDGVYKDDKPLDTPPTLAPGEAYEGF